MKQRRASPNATPIANAGLDQTVTLPVSSVALSGQVSSDPDGTIASYSWTKIQGGSATLGTPTQVSTQVSGLAQGSYVFRLTVTDNLGSTASDEVQITVNPAPGGNIPSARTLTARSTTVRVAMTMIPTASGRCSSSSMASASEAMAPRSSPRSSNSGSGRRSIRGAVRVHGQRSE